MNLTTFILTLFALLVSSSSAQTVHAQKNSWQTRLVYAKDNATAIPLATSFNIDFDSKNIYITAVCSDPKISELRKLPPGRQGEWPACDSIELFFDPGRTRGKYFQIAVGVNGARFDSRCTGRWTTQWTSEIEFTRDAWKVRLVLPVTDSGMIRPKFGDVWGFNFCRNVKLSGDYFSTWAHVGSVFHRPASFGKLIFGSPDIASQAMARKISHELSMLEKELRQENGFDYFARKLQKLHERCSELDIRDIRDEWIVIKAINRNQAEQNGTDR